MPHKSKIAICCLLLAVFLSSCTASKHPLETSLLIYRFEPSAFLEYSSDVQLIKEMPFSIPPGCGLSNTFPAPTGNFFAVELNCPGGQSVLFLDTETGSVTQPITDSDSHFLAWTSDGKAVYLKVDSLGSPKIIRVFINGKRDPLAANEFTYDLSAQPGSYDFTFTFSRGLGYGSEMNLAKRDGRVTQLLYEDKFNYISYARWSPNGKQIAFVKIPDSQTPFMVGELWSVNADGSNAHKLADADTGHGFAANWSPDGTKIAFVVRENPEDQSADQNAGALLSNIYTIEAAGGKLNQLTHFKEGYAGTPFWSPDGNTLAFTAVIDGRMEVQIADAATGETRSLITGATCCPAWMRK